MSVKTFSNEQIDFKRVIEMGQLFLYEKLSETKYRVYASNHACEINISSETSTITSTAMSFWENYFDLNRNYAEINHKLREHCIAHNDEYGLACIEEGKGLRLCNQPYWDTCIEFLLSAQNTVQNIRKTMFKIRELSTETDFEFELGLEFKTFPTKALLLDKTEDDFKACGAGFRSKYLVDFVKNASCPVGDYEHIMKELQKFKGIGPKVAGCIALYSLRQTDAFPIDVWIQRMLDIHYPNNSFVKPDKNAGILQLYMYEKIRRDSN